MFDVLVYNAKTMQDVVYRNAIPKSDAKRLVKNLKKNGYKAQLVTSKGQRDENFFNIEKPETDEE